MSNLTVLVAAVVVAALGCGLGVAGAAKGAPPPEGPGVERVHAW